MARELLDANHRRKAYVIKVLSLGAVWSDTLINVGGFDHNGAPFAYTSLKLLQDDEEAPEYAYAEWMPYQKGQAAKTEALEAATKAA
jgi:hypothetical protein